MQQFNTQSHCRLINYVRGKRSVNVLMMSVFLTMLLSFVCTVNAQRDYGIHDPSNIVKEGDTYFTFYTSRGVEYATSTDLCTWRNGGRVFSSGWPEWINRYSRPFGGHFWAPEVFYMNGKWHVYYSCSSFGSQNSAIGVATSQSLQNPQWQDQGMVVYTDSLGGFNHNAIDADVFRADDGRVFLVYGSYWAGIIMTELDTTTGKPFDRNDLHYVAGGDPEAGYAMKHGDYYYLFFNRGKCCDGLNSTYYILVGRSTSPTGPFYDKNGRNTRDRNGGTVILDDEGRFIGPGHFGFFEEGGREYMSYHYYDGNQGGASKLKIATISWEDGWPAINTDFDACNPSVIEDCAGVNGGSAYVDDCGECVGGTTGLEPCVQDCNGDWGGGAYKDDCGACVGGQTQAQECAGSIQGEDAPEFDGVIESDNQGFVDEGYLNFTNETGASATWNIQAEEAVSAPITFVYANGSSLNRALSVSINGTVQKESVDMAPTQDWTNYRSVTFTLDFEQGLNQLTVTSLTDEGGPNIDMITFASDLLSESTVSVGLNTESDNRRSAIRYSKNRVCFYLDKESDVTLALYSIAGRKITTLFKGRGSVGRNSLSIPKDQVASGVYILKLTGAGGLTNSLTTATQ